MIPTHSVGKACLLIRSEPLSDPGNCSAGLAIAHAKYLNSGANQDKKRTFRAADKDKILWLFEAAEFPGNIFDRLSVSEGSRISSARKRGMSLRRLLVKPMQLNV